MKIKQEEKISPLQERTRNYFKNSNPFSIWVMALMGIGLSVVIFFSTLGYGAYLKKIGKATYFNQVMLSLADGDLSFIKNYANGNLSKIDDVQIDLKFKYLQRMQYLREEALKQKYIPPAFKNEEFPATLTINGEAHKVKIGLTGMTTEHVIDPDKWSFEVKVRGDDTVKGMKRFGLLIPKSRGFMSDWLAIEMLKERGLIGLRVDFVDVTINGEPTGIYYMEERFDKHLLESNKFRESIIFKLDDGVQPYKESKLMADDGNREILLEIKRKWQSVVAGDLSPEQFFNMRKLASVFVSTDLMNNKHPLYPGNLRFYWNPMTNLAEPIAREYGSLHKYQIENLAMFLEKPKPENYRHAKLRGDKVLQIIYQNELFQRHYIQEAEIMADELFIDTLLMKQEQKINTLIKKVYRNWPFYELPSRKLYQNAQYVRDAINPSIDMIVAYFNKLEDNNIKIHIKNQQYLPVEVSYLNWRDSILFLPKSPTIIPSKEGVDPKGVAMYDFVIPGDVTWSDEFISELQIVYSILGSTRGKKSSLIFPWTHESRLSHSDNQISRPGNQDKFSFIQTNNELKTITIPAGKWKVTEDLVLPKGFDFHIEKGAHIDMVNGSKIISHAPVFSMGTKENPVLIESSDSTGRGFVVLEAGKRSKLNYTTFSKLSHPKDIGYNIPGATTFYESPVDFFACTFSSNLIGDDILNVVRSDFSMDETLFEHTKADAFDCDFCTGKITNTRFIDIGNDGVDVSGTKLEIENLTMDKIGDKGLSAGEDSEMIVSGLTVTNAEIGITAKDQSHIELTDAKLTNCRIGVTLFQKKSEFGAASMSGNQMVIKNSELPHLIEKNSKYWVDGEVFAANRDNVKEILYGAEYGKASR